MPDRFLHDHPDFDDLLAIVSEQVGVSAALVEKDYWVTHTLWALESSGLRVFFKGGTSLSKGFALIQRFSEDLDLKIEAPGLPQVSSWRSEGTRATNERRHFYAALQGRLVVPGAEVTELDLQRDPTWRNIVYAVRYPSRLSRQLPPAVRPFLQLEVGSARVTPGSARPISSWVHEHVSASAPKLLEELVENRPREIHCVAPEVTLLEKVEAISRRYARESVEPGAFVRHYEDVARILGSWDSIPVQRLVALLAEMRKAGDIRSWPRPEDPAFLPEADPERWSRLEKAWQDNAPLFWGSRVHPEECAARIRELLRLLQPASTPS